jgi:hypothetical protein
MYVHDGGDINSNAIRWGTDRQAMRSILRQSDGIVSICSFQRVRYAFGVSYRVVVVFVRIVSSYCVLGLACATVGLAIDANVGERGLKERG